MHDPASNRRCRGDHVFRCCTIEIQVVPQASQGFLYSKLTEGTDVLILFLDELHNNKAACFWCHKYEEELN